MPSHHLPDYDQPTFAQYVRETRAWLLNNRAFISQDINKELNANSPREYKPVHPNGGAVLLVHGLGDSPYSFIDIAQHLAQQGTWSEPYCYRAMAASLQI
ncbi:hypothetical protein [Dongshaea marina]|uniref:hypothetical protein n=1 Tax=Dongshaea marina TaxID=2047966 RepID=UPI0018FFCF36|nr:hypothetical protein [Dongshaea marina]